MAAIQIKVNDKYSVSRSTSQYICTFHAVESEGNKQDEVIKTFPCLLSMYSDLTEEGECGLQLMDAVHKLLEGH